MCHLRLTLGLTLGLTFGLTFGWQAVDFLDKLLRYDHQERLTAREAMVSICQMRMLRNWAHQHGHQVRGKGERRKECEEGKEWSWRWAVGGVIMIGVGGVVRHIPTSIPFVKQRGAIEATPHYEREW